MSKNSRPSIKDVALIAGVSTATVSHVINGTRYVSDTVKERVNTAMEEIGYCPNLLARSLRNHESKTIGLVIPDISNFYYTGVAEAVERTLKKQGYHIVLGNSYDDISNEKEIIQLYNSLQISGLIMVPAIGSQEYLSSLVGNRYPIVFADRRPTGYDGDHVILENTQATYEAIDLLIKKGYKRIALVAGDKLLSTTGDRILGYEKALKENGIVYDTSLIIEGKFTYESGYNTIKELIANNSVDAIFFANESAAIGGITALNEANRRIPEDVAVISCNDFKWTEITNPPITVVSQPAAELGMNAAKLLIRRLILKEAKKSQDREYKHLSVPTKIVIRQSC